MKYRKIIYWLIVFCGLFAYLQIRYSFLFYYLEEQQLFLFTSRYALDVIIQPGGLAIYLARFVVQLYYLPYAGAFLLATALTCIGIFSQSIITRTVRCCRYEMPEMLSFGLALLPMFAVLVLHLDVNYFMQGTLAYLIMLVAIRIYLQVNVCVWRIVAGLILFPLIYFAAGSVALLGAVCAFLCDALMHRWLWFISSIYPLMVMIVGIVCVRCAVFGNYRMSLLADMYYDPLLHPSKLLYPWYMLITIIILSWLIRKVKNPSGKVKKYALYFFPLSIIAAFAFVSRFFELDDASAYNIRQDYYLRHCMWDNIIEDFNPEKGNIQTMNVLNFALSEKGELCNRLFEFRQAGVKTLLISWDSSVQLAMPLCDIFYGVGDIASAQKLAFEGNVSSTCGGNVRLLQRLVETNIVCGEYKVAEKYINMLEHTLFYRDWAVEHRKYLYNDAAVEEDAELGSKRRGFKGDGQHYAVSEQVVETMERLSVNNPQGQSAVQYLAAFYMLAKDVKQICRLVDTYYGTDVLPSLPVSLQEAIVAVAHDDGKYFVQHGISADVEKNFRRFNLFVDLHHNDPDFGQVFAEKYGHTYWYYLLMYKAK